jgi:hypothetical protein
MHVNGTFSGGETAPPSRPSRARLVIDSSPKLNPVVKSRI